MSDDGRQKPRRRLCGQMVKISSKTGRPVPWNGAGLSQGADEAGKREPRTRDPFAARGIIGTPMRIVSALVLLIALAPAAFGQSREDNDGARHARVQPPTDQIIVKWRDGTTAAGTHMQKLSASS